MRSEPTIAVWGLQEIHTAQRFPLDPTQHPAFNLWAHWFENIENERIPIWRIGVQA